MTKQQVEHITDEYQTKQWKLCNEKDKYDLSRYHYKVRITGFKRTFYRKPRDTRQLIEFMYIKRKDIKKKEKEGWKLLSPVMQMLTIEKKYHKIGQIFTNYD